MAGVEDDAGQISLAEKSRLDLLELRRQQHRHYESAHVSTHPTGDTPPSSAPKSVKNPAPVQVVAETVSSSRNLTTSSKREQRKAAQGASQQIDDDLAVAEQLRLEQEFFDEQMARELQESVDAEIAQGLDIRPPDTDFRECLLQDSINSAAPRSATRSIERTIDRSFERSLSPKLARPVETRTTVVNEGPKDKLPPRGTSYTAVQKDVRRHIIGVSPLASPPPSAVPSLARPSPRAGRALVGIPLGRAPSSRNVIPQSMRYSQGLPTRITSTSPLSHNSSGQTQVPIVRRQPAVVVPQGTTYTRRSSAENQDMQIAIERSMLDRSNW